MPNPTLEEFMAMTGEVRQPAPQDIPPPPPPTEPPAQGQGALVAPPPQAAPLPPSMPQAAGAPPQAPPSPAEAQTAAISGGAKPSPSTAPAPIPPPMISRKQFEDVFANPWISEESKALAEKMMYDQRQPKEMKVEGGKLQYTVGVNGKPTAMAYTPEPHFGKVRIGGAEYDTISMKRTLNGPWETKAMTPDGKPIDLEVLATEEGLKKYGEAAGKQAESVRDEAEKALKLQGRLAEMKNLASQISVGYGQDARSQIGSVFIRMGFNPDVVNDWTGASTTEAFDKSSVKMAAESAKILGSRITEMEFRTFWDKGGPNPRMTPEALSRVIQDAETQNNLAIEKHKVFTEWRMLHPDPKDWPKFDVLWNEHIQKKLARGELVSQKGMLGGPAGKRGSSVDNIPPEAMELLYLEPTEERKRQFEHHLSERYGVKPGDADKLLAQYRKRIKSGSIKPPKPRSQSIGVPVVADAGQIKKPEEENQYQYATITQ